MSESHNEPAATAWHEAGHAVAGHLKGVPPERVELLSPGEGVTRFDAKALAAIADRDVIIIVLAGRYAEELVDPLSALQRFSQIVSGAASDTSLIYRRFAASWARSDSLLPSSAHGQAEALVRQHEEEIRAVAGGLLAKGVPASMDAAEFQAILARFTRAFAVL